MEKITIPFEDEKEIAAPEYTANPLPPTPFEIEEVEGDTVTQRIAEDPFSELLSAEELAELWRIGVKHSEGPVVMTIGGMELEGVREDQDSIAKKAARLDPNKFKDKLNGVNLYLNGIQITKDQLLEIIEENKPEFVAACRQAFPNIREMIEQERDEEPREEQKEPEPEIVSLEERINRASDRMSKHELLEIEEGFFDTDEPRRSATFYFHDKKGEIAETAELVKYNDKRIIKINGERRFESDLHKLIKKYPGEMRRQVQALNKTPAKEKQQHEKSR